MGAKDVFSYDMPRRLVGRVAIITGGGHGIGKDHVAEQLQQLHPGGRADRDDRGRGGTAAPAASRGADGVSTAEHRGQG